MAWPTRLKEKTLEEYIRQGFWSAATLADYWDRNVAENPSGIAVTDGSASVSWIEAKLWSDRLATALVHLGLERDDLLVVQLPNCVELPLIRLACEKAGVLCLPVPRTLRHHEMRHCLQFTEAKAVAIPRRYRDFDYFEMIRELRPDLARLRHVLVTGEDVPVGGLSVQDLVRRRRENEEPQSLLGSRRYPSFEVSLINATTGSTGLPKFAEYTAAARLLYGLSYIEVLRLSRQDVLAALSPAAGGPNIPVYFAAPQIGAKTVLMSHFEPGAALELIEQEKVTLACLVPAQLALLARYPQIHYHDLSSVRFWLSVGAPLSAHLARETEEKLGGTVLNTYGAVDWGGVVFTSPDDPDEVRYSTVGRPRVGTKVRLVEDHGKVLAAGEIGELQGRGPTSSTGFYKDPEATMKAWTPDGWFPLGDLGRWDETGNLILSGRKSEMIIRGGQNIQPEEIENLLLAHPEVKQAAVVGMPDPVLGERVCAYVVSRGDERPALEEIVDFLQAKKIAPYKLPERLEVVESLPMISDTKVDKRLLSEDIAAKLRSKC
jgi:non-ribosomal peptide synthetase component E (peptide arylation enzyme)